MAVELNNEKPLKSETPPEDFHPSRDSRGSPRADDSRERCSIPVESREALRTVTTTTTMDCEEDEEADSESGEGQKCKVCGDSVGALFGSVVCLPCKTFFQRYGSDHESFTCKFGGNCSITPLNRTRCKHCRYNRCYAVGMWKKVRPAEIQVRDGQQACVVCHDVANGVHFGAITCEGCKKFFRRGLLEHDSYSCKNDKRCPINPQTRNSCRYCRYQKCLQAGMSREAIQMGRPSKMKSEALRFLRINNNNNNNNRQQQHKKSKKRINSSAITAEENADDDDDNDDGKTKVRITTMTANKKRKNCSPDVDPKEKPDGLTSSQASKAGLEADCVSPPFATPYNGLVGGHDPSPASRLNEYWGGVDTSERNESAKVTYSKRPSATESTKDNHLQSHVQAADLRGHPIASVNGPRVRNGAEKSGEDYDLRRSGDDPQWFSPRSNRQGPDHARDYSASYDDRHKGKSSHYELLHQQLPAAIGNRDLRVDKYSGTRVPLDRQTFTTNGAPPGYGPVTPGQGEYHLRHHRLNQQQQTSCQQRISSGGLYQNHQPLHPNNNGNSSLTAQDIIQNSSTNNNNYNNNNNSGLLPRNDQRKDPNTDYEVISRESSVQFPLTTLSAAGIDSVRYSSVHNSILTSRLSPARSQRSSYHEMVAGFNRSTHPNGVTGFNRSDPRVLQRAMVGKSMMKLMAEHDKVYNPRGQQVHSMEQGDSFASLSSSSSPSSSSSSSLLMSLSHMNDSKMVVTSASLNSPTSGVRSSRTPASSSVSDKVFLRQQSPTVLGADRSSPYSSVMMLLSSCQLFNEASKNPFQQQQQQRRHQRQPSNSEASAKGVSDVSSDPTCNSSSAVESTPDDDDDDCTDRNSGRSSRIIRLLDSPEQSRVTETYWLRHDQLPDESLMLTDKHFEVIHQIVLAYEKFLQCGTNINVTLKKELESWNLHSQVPLQGSISLPEWIQVKVIPVYTYTSITYCKSLPGFTDLPLTDQATLIRLGQTQSRIMLAAVHWFDSQKKNFEDFLSWRPLDLFKQRLIAYAEKIHKLQLDFIESALLNALIIIAADFPGLENPALINQLRQRVLLPFRAYTTAKFGTPNHRLERLFRHIPETRQLGFLHYKMTMKASLRAEEVERQGTD